MPGTSFWMLISSRPQLKRAYRHFLTHRATQKSLWCVGSVDMWASFRRRLEREKKSSGAKVIESEVNKNTLQFCLCLCTILMSHLSYTISASVSSSVKLMSAEDHCHLWNYTIFPFSDFQATLSMTLLSLFNEYLLIGFPLVYIFCLFFCSLFCLMSLYLLRKVPFFTMSIPGALKIHDFRMGEHSPL